MFICKKCHDEAGYKGFHIFISYGPCEICHEVTDCYDCQCYRDLDSEEEVPA